LELSPGSPGEVALIERIKAFNPDRLSIDGDYFADDSFTHIVSQLENQDIDWYKP
jgi:hypothetical protein